MKKIIKSKICPLALPLGQVPVLIVDGVQYCQTAAILEYCAKLAKLAELSDIEELRANMVIETVNELVKQTSMPAKMAMNAVPASGLVLVLYLRYNI